MPITRLAFSHAAVRAIQYVPEIWAFYRALGRRTPAVAACAVVAKELARIVYYVLSKQAAFNGTFKGKPLSRTKQPKWPRAGLCPASPPAELEPSARRACISAAFDWAPGGVPPADLAGRPLGPVR